MIYIDTYGNEVDLTLGQPYHLVRCVNNRKTIFIGDCLTQEMLAVWIKLGYFKVKESSETLTVEKLLQSSNIPGNDVDEQKAYICDLYDVCPSAAITLVLKEASKYFDTKHNNHIMESDEVWGVSWTSMDTFRILKRSILETAYASLFRTEEEASNALDLVFELIKANEHRE